MIQATIAKRSKKINNIPEGINFEVKEYSSFDVNGDNSESELEYDSDYDDNNFNFSSDEKTCNESDTESIISSSDTEEIKTKSEKPFNISNRKKETKIYKVLQEEDDFEDE
jgi:hypothetical protein